MTKIKCSTWRDRGKSFKYAHLKMDGIFLRVTKGRTETNAWTSNPTNVTSQLIHAGFMEAIHHCCPPCTTLLGELYAPGQQASQVKSLLAQGLDHKLRFGVFAVESYDVDYPLEELDAECNEWGLDFLPFLTNPIISELLENLPDGAEGYVLKNGNLLDWEKLKRVVTIDLVIHGLNPGKGKYLGQCGALVCGLAGGQVIANVSGMTDDVRADIDESWIGSVVEVAYQYVGTGGRLRHPRFVRRRDDKLAMHCTSDQDPNLERHYT